MLRLLLQSHIIVSASIQVDGQTASGPFRPPATASGDSSDNPVLDALQLVVDEMEACTAVHI
jgi:hypothetical protein